ncbi:MAG: enoyl-CoA hydratase [Pseudomonadota bacterium]
MQWDTIRMKTDGSISFITLNRPERMNALNFKLTAELTQALDKCAEDNSVNVVVLQGAPRFFCVGADITEVSDLTSAGQLYSFLDKVRVMFQKIEFLPKPVVAAVEGYALGGGCELALACDLRLASESARFGVPEIEIGAIPGAGGTSRLPRVIGPTRAKEMVFFGEQISAHEAYRIGLVNRVFPDDEFKDDVLSYVQKLAQKAPVAIRFAKQSINCGLTIDPTSSRIIEALSGSVVHDTEDRKEGMKAFLEKRKPVFQGK